MQIKYLHKSFYKLYGYSRKQENLDTYRRKYQHIVNKWENLKNAGTKEDKIPQFVDYSRATYYRAKKILSNLNKWIIPPSKAPKKRNKPRWGESEKQWVLQIRLHNPTYGKFKIQVILRRDHGLEISESTVGRILNHLKAKGLITKSLSAIRTKKKRDFNNGHAVSWSYKNYNKMVLGERIQVDHMTVTKNGVSFKHFQAWERKSKFIHAQLYDNATSRSAKKFILELLEIAPFSTISIQVDGGSEFMGEFEAACLKLGMELIVLPPASPTKNGGVERGNRTFREECFARPTFSDSLGAFRIDLKEALKKYNTYRPHGALDGLTPMEYITKHNYEVAA
jgi:putative transposase